MKRLRAKSGCARSNTTATACTRGSMATREQTAYQNRPGLVHRYKRTIEALRSLKVNSAYLDGELCALNADGVPVFSRLQEPSNAARSL